MMTHYLKLARPLAHRLLADPNDIAAAVEFCRLGDEYAPRVTVDEIVALPLDERAEIGMVMAHARRLLASLAN
jgi:hypothetical protein